MNPVNYNSLIIFAAIGVILPFIVDLVTNRLSDGRIKALILLLLATISSALTELFTVLNNGGTWSDWDWRAALFGILLTFVTAVSTFFGALRPMKISGADGKIQQSLPSGIGKPHS